MKLRLGLRQEQAYELQDLPSVTPEQRAHRAAWIHGDDESRGNALIRAIVLLAFWAVSILIVGPVLLLYALHQRRHQPAVLQIGWPRQSWEFAWLE